MQMVAVVNNELLSFTDMNYKRTPEILCSRL
nr:MAG TPA: hypothetical protein [Caudoviricetes sp.]